MASPILLSALLGCAGPERAPSPQAAPTDLTSGPLAVCPGEVNAPYGSPSMMPVESGAPPESGGSYEAPQWPPQIDTATCTKVVTAVLASKAFADQHLDHHVEIGAARPYSENKDPPCSTYEAGCWSVTFYDYDLKSAHHAIVDSASGGVIRLRHRLDAPVSQAEADRAMHIALQDPSVAEAYGDASGWWHWLYEISPGTEESPCRVNRCVSARTWRLEGGALLNVIVDLHRGQLEAVELP